MEQGRRSRQGPSAAWPGALETARKKMPGRFGRDDSESDPKMDA